MSFEPTVNGLRPGCLVEIRGVDEERCRDFSVEPNGELGQLLSYIGGDTNRFHVQLLCGAAGYFDPENVVPAKGRRRPGEGGDAKSFDMVVGPRTDPVALGNEMAVSLVGKGFCVLRCCQSPDGMERTMDLLQELEDDGKLARLPEEVEEGYLGENCRARVAWLGGADEDLKRLGEDPFLSQGDALLSFLAGVLQPFSGDALGEFVDERTPALVALSLTLAQEPEYPFPEADDRVLGAFLETWRRTILRAVAFSGPGTPHVLLENTCGLSAGDLASAPTSIDITASPNTVLLFRPDVFEYTCDAGAETLMTLTSFLSPAPRYAAGGLRGDTAWLLKREGPPKPPGENHVYVLNSVARLPAAFDDQWSFFAGLKSACDGVIKIPLTRGDVDPYYTTNIDTPEPWQTFCQHQSYCEGTEMFDNKHFEISTAEAAGMDPVQRLIMEAGSQSMAMIGLTKKITNRKSIHAAFAVGNDKLDWCGMDKDVQCGGAMAGTSTVLAIIANRFSFVYNLKGPSFVCDTACSASLSSTHCIKMMMLDRKNDPLEFAISMGAHLVLTAIAGVIGGTQSHMGGPLGRCLTFNASASGYLRGEGISGILLKYGNYQGESDAILRATQLGQDGRSATLTAPNGPSQEEMITRAIKEAQMTPPESTVWECHGTGTALGDPIEVGAVRKVQIRMRRLEPLMITSNKTNIGHLEGGAAMGGICKCVLQCKYAKCMSTLHLRTLNAHLEHAAFEAIFQTESACYAYTQGHSQVSSFGFGGSNGHGVFWGENVNIVPNAQKTWEKKLAARPPPEVRVIGKSYDEWEADFPDPRRCKRGDVFSVTMGPNDPADQPVKWEPVEQSGDDAEDDEDTSYTISGNFNKWDDDRMVAGGSVPGVHAISLEVPENGVLEFYFHRNSDRKQVLCPDIPDCSRRAEPIIGPQNDLRNKWVVRASPSAEVTVELFVVGGRKAVTWIVGAA